MQIGFLIFLFILGACFGSFLCCEARRLHLKVTKKHKKFSSRSVCLSCNYKLKWYDNIPVISWVVLKGKCRKCRKKIGLAEILSEIGLGLTFLGFGTTIDVFNADIFSWLLFIFALVLSLLFGFLAIYDGLYGELPTFILTISIICAIIISILKQWILFSNFGFSWGNVIDLILSVAILGGLYFLLYLISRGRWVGDGDWLLGIAIGLALGSPWLALLTLFLSNLLASLIMFPIVKGKNSKIPFGPFLVLAFIIVYVFSDIINNLL